MLAFETLDIPMDILQRQRQRLLKAKIAVALLEELGRRPTDQELDQYLRVLLKAATGYTVASGGRTS